MTEDAQALLEPYQPDALVRFGTSSFSSKDWVGPFYKRGTPPGRFLVEYARELDTVEVDATYYALPSARRHEWRRYWRVKARPSRSGKARSTRTGGLRSRSMSPRSQRGPIRSRWPSSVEGENGKRGSS